MTGLIKAYNNCNLVIDESGGDYDGSAAVVAADFVLNGTATISDNKYKSVTLCNVVIENPTVVRDDALDIHASF